MNRLRVSLLSGNYSKYGFISIRLNLYEIVVRVTEPNLVARDSFEFLIVV